MADQTPPRTNVLEADLSAILAHIADTPGPNIVRDRLRRGLRQELEAEYEGLAAFLTTQLDVVDDAVVESFIPDRPHDLGIRVSTDDPETVREFITDHQLPLDELDRTDAGLDLQ